MEPVQHLLELGRNYVDRQPTLALAFGAALITVVAAAARTPAATLPLRIARFGWGLVLAGFLVGAALLLKSYQNEALSDFRRTHGRVSEANYEAVQNIWGPEQNQQELTVEFSYDEEVTERVEFDDPTKPAMIKKKVVHRIAPGNPFESARHEVTLRQNPRKKGSAIYPGYETDCRFTYKLRYPGEHDAVATLRFPLPSSSVACNDLAINLDGTNVLGQLQIEGGALVLPLDVKKGWAGVYEISFKSRGVSVWYFQVSEERVIRDFLLTLHLPDLPREKLNYPEGCMTPTEIAGHDLIYRLGNAVSSKGMGIALARPEQPGTTMNAVLSESSTAWTLVFAGMVSGLTLAGMRRAVLLSVFIGVAVTFGYGLLGNFHDIVFGFWGSALVVLVPVFALLAVLATRMVNGPSGKLLGGELVVFGVVYPALAGLDTDRQSLYLNLCAVFLLAIMAWQLRYSARPVG
jgi:hypothetical protein